MIFNTEYLFVVSVSVGKYKLVPHFPIGVAFILANIYRDSQQVYTSFDVYLAVAIGSPSTTSKIHACLAAMMKV